MATFSGMLKPTDMLALLPGLPQGRAPQAEEVDGFFAADSMVRRLHRERLVLFSGVRALLMQACDPLAVVGFERHSVIFDDPQARLLRTDERMSRIYFGSGEEAERTGRIVRAMHRRVRGETPADYGPIPKGTPYDATDPELGLWVLATLADSALVYYERIFGALKSTERERYWSEYRRVGELLGLPPGSMPATHADLKDYVQGRLGDGSLWISDERRDVAVQMILEPPYSGWLRLAVTPVTETVKLISVGLLPPEIRRLFGFGWDPGREALLRSALLQLRVGSRFWLDAVRLHPAARAAAGERYGALAG
ncbi:MAG TPA: oxygenase MpaB family protein [Solirubrobacterales bacterium]|nr:oxygenase MpaB family protein [Solirubrobacterales bacterium]